LRWSGGRKVPFLVIQSILLPQLQQWYSISIPTPLITRLNIFLVLYILAQAEKIALVRTPSIPYKHNIME
jgi:hypothetical protein